MTDPNLPPPDRVIHQTTINAAPEPRRGGGMGMAFILGALVVAAAVLAWFVFADGRAPAPETPELNVDINVPAPRLPDTPDLPKLPDRVTPPELPKPAAPPTVVAPEPKG